MPVINLNKKVFQKLVGKNLSDQELKDRISYLGTDLDEITKDEIIVEIFPNRPDLMSEYGFARAFSSFIGKNTGLKKYQVIHSDHKLIVEPSVKDVRPYTACAIVKDLKLDNEKIKEIIQIQEKLHITYGRNRARCAIGIYPFDIIKTPIRYLAKKPENIKFKALESNKILNAKQILYSHSAGKEYGHLLNGKSKYPIFVDADDKILSMPPIINSNDVGKITPKTKDIFIECSGHNYDIQSICLNIIVTAFADMGGKIYSMKINYPDKKYISPDLNPKKMKLDLNYVNKRLGIKLTESKIKFCLEKMGFNYSSKGVQIPAYRQDILHQIDLIEDIAIAYGYENFPEVIPKVATIGKESNLAVFSNKITDILVGLGFMECKTFHLIGKDDQTTKMNCNLDIVELKNALNLDYNSLVYWNTPSLLHVLSNNKHHEYPQNIFTITKVFKKDKNTDTGILEQVRLSVLLCSEDADFTRIKQVLDYLFRMICKEYKIQKTEHPSFIPGRVGRVSSANNNIAYIGEIAPIVLKNWDISVPVASFELNLTELLKQL